MMKKKGKRKEKGTGRGGGSRITLINEVPAAPRSGVAADCHSRPPRFPQPRVGEGEGEGTEGARGHFLRESGSFH